MKSDNELAIVLGLGPKRGQPPTLPRKAPVEAEPVESPTDSDCCAHTSICPFYKAKQAEVPEAEPEV